MAGSRLYTTNAIVLNRFPFGEADRILTILTPGLGKIKAIAKGVRRPTSRLGGSLEPLAELRLQLARGRTFDVVTQVVVLQPWLRLRDALPSAATAWTLAELADRALEERQPAEGVYELLRTAYTLLDGGMAPSRVGPWFEIRLLAALGLRPELDRCAECGRPQPRGAGARWVPVHGGVVCLDCSALPGATELSGAALTLLRAYQRLDPAALAALRIPAEVEREAEGALRGFITAVLERELRSWAFLDELRRGEAPERSATIVG